MASAQELSIVLTADDRVSGVLDNVQQNIGGLSGAIQKHHKAIGIGMTAVGTAVVGAGILSIKAFGNFEAGMREVNTMIGLGEKELKAFTAEVRNMSARIGVDAVGSTQALYQAISAGIPRENVMAFLEIATKAAIGGVTNTVTAVDGLTSAINAYGMQAGDASKIADIMFTTVRLGKTTFEELSSSMGKVLPLAASMGIEFKDVMAATASLTKSGLSTSEAITAIRGTMVALVRPNETMVALLQKAGYETSEAMLQSLGYAGTLEALSKSADHNNEVLSAAFGRVEALGAALGLTGDKAAGAKADLAAMATASEGAGASMAAFDEVNKGVNRQLEMLKARFAGVSLAIGQQLLPLIVPLIGKLTDILQRVAEWSKANPELARVITIVTAAIGALMLVLGPLMIMLPTLITSYGLLKKAKLKAAAATKLLITNLGVLKAVTKTKIAIMAAASKGMVALTAAAKGLKIAIAIMTGPIGLIVAAIAGLIAIGISLYKNWDEISAKAKEIWGAIASFFGDIWDKITDIFNSAFEFIKKVFLDYHPLGIIISNWEPIKDFLANLWDTIIKSLTWAFNFIKDIFLNFHPLGIIISNWEPIQSFLADLWDNITGALKSAWDNIKSFMAALNPWEWMKAGWEVLKDGISNILNWIFGGSIINDWASGMMGFLQSLNPWEWMKAGWETLSSGISTIWDNITGIISEKVDVIQGFLGSVWDKAAGLVDFARTQAGRAGELLAGARDAAAGALQKAERAAAGIVSGARDAAAGAWQAAGGAATGAWQAAGGAATGVVGAVTGAVGGALEQAREWLPGFQHGGIVPGPTGRPVPILAHGGERIIPVGQRAAVVSPQQTIQVYIQNGTFLGDEAEAQRWGDRLGEVLQQKTRMGWSMA